MLAADNSDATLRQFRPVAEPIVVDGVLSDDQVERLIGVVRRNGPWPTIMAHHFSTPAELIASTAGFISESARLSWEGRIEPVFRGALATGGTCLFPEIEDVFLSPRLLALARRYWGAAYARAELLQFSVSAPMSAGDTPHVDAADFRGLSYRNTPVWLLNIMARSGLFGRWLSKKVQVITWFYRGASGGGFTYWPDGPSGQPKRLAGPMWNRSLAAQAECMYHKADDSGPVELRKRQGLAFHSVCDCDASGWHIATDGKRVQSLPEREMRFMFHWSGEVFVDEDDLKRVIEHEDDLTHAMVFDTFRQDLQAKGIRIALSSAPMRDEEFIRTLTRVYRADVPRLGPAGETGPGAGIPSAA